MKSKKKKRILAAVLCMVMVLTNCVSILAEGGTELDAGAAAAVEAEETTLETKEAEASEIPAEPEQPTEPEAPTEPEQPAAPAEPEKPAEPEQPKAPAEPEQPKAPAEPEQTPAQPEVPTEPETPAEPEQPEEPEQAETVFSEAVELKQEFRDSAGHLVQRITAKLPQGAFEAETSAVSMEVSYVNDSSDKYMKKLMKERLPEGKELGDYLLYKIEFKVNGEVMDSLEPIEITFEKSDLEIPDIKKASVFYFKPDDPQVSGDRDELVEIIQRSELIENFRAAGKSTANIDEEYDLSSIKVGEENRSEKIVLEGRISTIYGCYVEKEPEPVPEEPQAEEPTAPKEPAEAEEGLKYEDDQVAISVTASEEGAIPEGAALKVTPITAEDTKEQYEEVEKQIQEKVAEEEKEVAGFLAYDITFVDKDGNKMEPNGKVKVSMDYKKAELPQEVLEKEAIDAEVTVLHLEEDENGKVKQVVDMGAEQKANVDTLITTEGTKVQNVAVETESFSVFTITWKYKIVFGENGEFNITVHYVDEIGQEINVQDNPDSIQIEADQFIQLSDYWRDAIDSQYQRETIKVDTITGKEVVSLTTKSEPGARYVKYTKKGENGLTNWLASGQGNRLDGDIYFIYKKDSSSGGSTGGGSSATGNLAHSKYVTANGDGTYDLTLDVVGAVGTETNPAAVDIVFVLDLSGSMKGTNLADAKSAVKTLTDNLSEKNTVDSKWKLVTFASSASVQIENWISATEINSKIQEYSDDNCNGGTNYEAGLTQAGSVLGTARADSVKIVIFLTDGEPTYHGTNSKGGGNRTYEKDYEGALKGAGKINCDRFYSVGMGLKSEIPIYEYDEKEEEYVENRRISGKDLLIDVANATNSQYRQAINVGAGESLDQVFSEISGSITKYVASNVTITDRLTQEVDLVNSSGEVTTDQQDLTVKVLDKEGRDVTSEEVVPGRITPSYDTSTKRISLDFSDLYQLKEGYKYSVTAKIKPNTQAIDKYKENDYSYPDTGETGTGASSEGKKGIFSNVEDSAKVTWTTNNEEKEGKYNRPVVQIPQENIPIKLKKEPVNFFLNLSSAILDTDGNISGQLHNAFTTSVSGSFSEGNGNQGCGVAINKDLRVVVPENHNHSSISHNTPYGVIGGKSNTNAKTVDEKIRQLGSQEGTKGNQDGTENDTYRIVDGNDQPKFPTDEEIFEYVRKNWNQEDGKGVNKGKDITVNGEAIDHNKLTTDNFTIRWYVFKDQYQDEYWHIDGILVPKSGILTVKKTFPNVIITQEVKNKFKIQVTGNFLGTSESSTIEKSLTDAQKVENADGTVTYEWSFAVFGNSYKVEELEYTLDSNSTWNYESTNWTYQPSSGQESNGTTTSAQVSTERTETDSTPKTQTLHFTNNYSTNNEDTSAYILVKKTFKGLSSKQISNLKDFSLTVTKKNDESFKKILTIGNRDSVTPDFVISDEVKDYTFTWKVDGCTTGTYVIEENGQELDQYDVTTSVNGEEGSSHEVTVEEGSWTFDPNVNTITSNNSCNFTISSDSIVMATLKSNNGYLIWTQEQLSETQKASIIQGINTNSELKTFKTGEATRENTHFYYGDSLKNGITVSDGTIKYDPDKEQLNFSGESLWKHVAAGTYTMTSPQNADIAVVNTYNMKKTSIDLKKFGTTYENPLDGAEFELYQGDKNETDGSVKWGSEMIQKIIVNNADTMKELDLPEGYYKLKEVTAPSGYQLLGKDIYFKIENRVVTLIDEAGKSLNGVGTEMWKLEGDTTNGFVISILNETVYELPSTGGSGIFQYIMGGTLLMIAAILMLYKMKYKGVLKS